MPKASERRSLRAQYRLPDPARGSHESRPWHKIGPIQTTFGLAARFLQRQSRKTRGKPAIGRIRQERHGSSRSRRQPTISARQSPWRPRDADDAGEAVASTIPAPRWPRAAACEKLVAGTRPAQEAKWRALQLDVSANHSSRSVQNQAMRACRDPRHRRQKNPEALAGLVLDLK